MTTVFTVTLIIIASTIIKKRVIPQLLETSIQSFHRTSPKFIIQSSHAQVILNINLVQVYD